LSEKSFGHLMRALYVKAIHVLRAATVANGLMNIFDKWARKSTFGLWIRSILSIYDLDDLVALDLPWWTFRATDIVEKFLQTRPNSRVFEFGSGSSTFWLAKRATDIVSIEHDPIWAQKVTKAYLPNAKVILIQPEPILAGHTPVRSSKKGFENLDFTNYVMAIAKVGGPFDVIVIDGRAREHCFESALNFLSPGGIIVFDNINRTRYLTAIEKFKDTLNVQITWGLTPTLPFPGHTAIISKISA
jgi:protein-L-isoaspartate O-methyltransferase